MCPSNPILNFLCRIVTLNENFSWPVVGDYLFTSFVIQAAILTVFLAVLAQLFGALIGLLLYFMRVARFAPLRSLANLYIWFFRGTPLLVQIVFTYQLFGYLHIYKPLRVLNFFPYVGYPQVQLDGFIGALAALSFNEGAYMAEIARAAISAIDVGQMEAAKSLGMTYFKAMRRIVLPQALRVIVPPLGNEFNSMLKNTSLASFVAVTELFQLTYGIGGALFRELEMMAVACFWYLVMTTVWTWIQSRIERRLNISVLDSGPPDQGSWLQRMLGISRRAKPTPAEVLAGLPADHR
jgi:polar amino acid transport system permease protein